VNFGPGVCLGALINLDAPPHPCDRLAWYSELLPPLTLAFHLVIACSLFFLSKTFCNACNDDILSLLGRSASMISISFSRLEKGPDIFVFPFGCPLSTGPFAFYASHGHRRHALVASFVGHEIGLPVFLKQSQPWNNPSVSTSVFPPSSDGVDLAGATHFYFANTVQGHRCF